MRREKRKRRGVGGGGIESRARNRELKEAKDRTKVAKQRILLGQRSRDRIKEKGVKLLRGKLLREPLAGSRQDEERERGEESRRRNGRRGGGEKGESDPEAAAHRGCF